MSPAERQLLERIHAGLERADVLLANELVDHRVVARSEIALQLGRVEGLLAQWGQPQMSVCIVGLEHRIYRGTRSLGGLAVCGEEFAGNNAYEAGVPKCPGCYNTGEREP